MYIVNELQPETHSGSEGSIGEGRLAPAAFDMYVRKRAPWFRSEDHAHPVRGAASWKGLRLR
jgi:hypothetical protein